MSVYFLIFVQREFAGNRFAVHRGRSAGEIFIGKHKEAQVSAVELLGIGGRLQRGRKDAVVNKRYSGGCLDRVCRLQPIREAALFNMQLAGNDLLAIFVRVIGGAVPCHGHGTVTRAGVGLNLDAERGKGKPQILKRRANGLVRDDHVVRDSCDRALCPHHGKDTFRRGVCLRIFGGKEDHHAVFARVYSAAFIILEAERAGNNGVRPLGLRFAAHERLVGVLIADIGRKAQRGRGCDHRFGRLQKLSVGRMAGFANSLLRGCSLAAGAVARFGMAAVRGAGACVRSVAVGGPFAPAMIVRLPYGIDGCAHIIPMYYQALGITAVSAIYRLTGPRIRPTHEGISVTGRNFVRYGDPYMKFRANHALTWRRAAAAVGIVIQRIGVLGGSGTDCPAPRFWHHSIGCPCRVCVAGLVVFIQAARFRRACGNLSIRREDRRGHHGQHHTA